MNLTDLREVLDEQSSTEHADVRVHLMLGGVHQRIRTRARRRRIGAVAAATLAVMTVGAGAFTLARAPEQSHSVAAAPMRTIEGFPEYAGGTRVIAAKSAQAPARSVSVSFVATSLDLTFFERCTRDNDTEYAVTVNGKPVMSGQGCSTSARMESAKLAKDYGIKVGATATVTMTMNGTPKGEFGVAVGAAVDPSAYQFPPRPAALLPLEAAPSDTPNIVRADPADPQRAITATLHWPRVDQMNMWTNTPGALTVRIDGVKVFFGQSWDYNVFQFAGPDAAELRELGLKLSPGQQITVSVTPERMTGDWVVAFEE